MTLKRFAKDILKKVGLDVRLARNIKVAEKKNWEEQWIKQWQFLKNHSINTIIDVGANTGQFAHMIAKVCPGSKIFSFEPLEDCFQSLQNTLKTIPGSKGFNLALGECSGSTVINRSNFSPSSSLLVMTDLHKRDWPHSAEHIRETIQIAKLDDIMASFPIVSELLVKIDVQGYEANVIKGGKKTISRASFVVVEVSFEELYKGQPLFDEIYVLMRNLGFMYHGNIDQYFSHVDGNVLFADALFEKNGG
jgi:FkbM family methyltransferase